jgi:hypothetical protein
VGAEPATARRKLVWDWGACRVAEEAAEAEESEEEEEEEDAELAEEPMQSAAGEDIDKGQSKRNRLTHAQVRALQASFNARSLLTPQQKLRLAHDLGLQPRQVAIWFQNHRARSKVKLLERRFSLLRSDYDALVAETQTLRSEVGVYIDHRF